MTALLKAILVIAVLGAGRDGRAGADLPIEAGAHRRAVSGRRLGRQHLARGGAAAGCDLGPADRDREQGGRRHRIAADLVAKSAPDGYTLFATGMETFAINPFMLAKLSYNAKDFTPVSGYGLSNQILVVPASSPFKTLADVMAHARAKPGELNYATIGLGGSSHINMVLFESMTGLKLTPVHYQRRRAGDADLLGRPCALGLPELAARDPGIRSGHIRPLAVGSKARLAQHPDVPTVAESGVPGFEAVSWFGIWAPAGTPRDVVVKVNADIQKVFADADFREKFLDRALLDAITGSPEQFGHSSRPRRRNGARWSRTPI